MNCFILLYALMIYTIGDATPAITRDIKVDLPGTEKINKRSPQNYVEHVPEAVPDSREEVFPLNKRSASSKEEESMETAENGLVFRPLFRTREHTSIKRARRFVNEKDDMNADETGIVYVPLFRSKDKFESKQRVRRSLNDVPEKVVGTPEDLGTSETIIFKPLFRRKSRGTNHDNDDIFGSRLVFQNQYS